jgi:hypothetical protein
MEDNSHSRGNRVIVLQAGYVPNQRASSSLPSLHCGSGASSLSCTPILVRFQDTPDSLGVANMSLVTSSIYFVYLLSDSER